MLGDAGEAPLLGGSRAVWGGGRGREGRREGEPSAGLGKAWYSGRAAPVVVVGLQKEGLEMRAQEGELGRFEAEEGLGRGMNGQQYERELG